jgi:hypothetical protein
MPAEESAMTTPQIHPQRPGPRRAAFRLIQPSPSDLRLPASALRSPASAFCPPVSAPCFPTQVSGLRSQVSARLSGVALVLTLAILVLITILVVGFATLMTTERSVARSQYESEAAKAIALNGRDLAVARLRAAIEAGSVNGKTWASQPGKISVLDIAGSISIDSSIDGDMFSKSNLSGNNSTGTVNLNAAGLGGSYPVAGAAGNGTGPVMDLDWVNVLRNGSTDLSSANATNPVVGRYAFWVDDETAKINFNTASGVGFAIIKEDGTGDWNTDADGDGYADPTNVTWTKPKAEGTPTWNSRSDGPGQPTEIELSALGYSQAEIAKISARARQLPFLEPRGLLGLVGANATLYESNKFNLTHYSRSPDVNFFGEPRIQLFPAYYDTITRQTRSFLVGKGVPGGNLSQSGDQAMAALQQYPTGRQLGNFSYRAWAGNTSLTALGNASASTQTGNWPMSFVHVGGSSIPQRLGIPGYLTGGYAGTVNVPLFDSATEEYRMGALIANYLAGRNSLNATVTWPSFPGSSGGANLGVKYNARQIDHISLQVLDIMRKGVLTDFMGNATIPSYLAKGWLSGEPVMGLARGPILTEVLLEIETAPDSGSGDGAQFRVNQLTLEFYVPEGFGPGPITNGTFGQTALGDGIVITGNTDWKQYFNAPEARGRLGTDGNLTSSSYESWWDTMWTVVNDLGNPCVDLRGAPKGNATAPLPDPDQDKAAAIQRPIIGNASYVHFGKRQAGGSFSTATEGTSLLQVYNPDPATPTDTAQNRAMIHRVNGSPFATTWYPGQWKTVTIRKNTNFVDMGADTFGISMRGGLSFWLNAARPSGTNDTARWTLWEAVPLGSLGGVPWVDGTNINASTDATIVSRLKEAVLPFPQHDDVDVTVGPQTLYYHWYVRDPMVNKFPGDWIAEFSLGSLPGNATLGAPPPEWGNSAKADSRALAWAELDPGATVRRTQRSSSVGLLSRIRTGVIPDNLTANLSEQKGTPFRTLNFAPSTDSSQQITVHETLSNGTNSTRTTSYPDWAMLDLFTVPGVANIGQTNVGERFTNFTSGGATAGRINPNSAIEPFATVTRNGTLAGAFRSLSVNPTTFLTSNASLNGTIDWNTGGNISETALADAVDDYVKNTLGRPLIMAAEIANVPEIANYTTSLSVTLSNSTSVTVRPRNDVLAQSVGHFNTQSNTFSVWAISQSITKARSNTAYDRVEPGDKTPAESRMRFIVERYLELGTDGFAGNKDAPGLDGQPGTLDDVVDAQLHPTLSLPLTGNNSVTGKPQYKYRVVYSEQVE